MSTVAQPQTPRNLVARYATFHGTSGYAIRTADMQVIFMDHAAAGRVLTNADIPALTLLGDVDLAEAQHIADALLGGAAAIACTRVGGVA